MHANTVAGAPMTVVTASQTPEERDRLRSIAFLNWAHAIDHFVLLIYPTVVIGLEVVYKRPYSELIAISSTAFIAFGVFSLPAGWLADRWSRRNMMVAFYIGCGAFAGAVDRPNFSMLAVGMFALGMFAAIYHPVGMAMLIEATARAGARWLSTACAAISAWRSRPASAAALATWWAGAPPFWCRRLLSFSPGRLSVVTPDDRHHTSKLRRSKPAVPLTPKVATMLFSLIPGYRNQLRARFQRADRRACRRSSMKVLPRPCRWCWSAVSPPPCSCAARWRSLPSAGWSNGCRRTLSSPR